MPLPRSPAVLDRGILWQILETLVSGVDELLLLGFIGSGAI